MPTLSTPTVSPPTLSLLLWLCTAAYAILAILQPHAFYLDPAVNLHPVPKGFDFIFFSFGSMTTAGAAGIAAASPQVRSVSMIESVLAVLYIAVMIARLMGAYRPTPHGSQESS